MRFRDVALEGVSLDAWCSGPRAALHARSPHRLRPAGTAPAGVNGPVGPSGASFVQEPSHARNGWDQAWHPRDVWLEDAQHKRGTPCFLGVRPFAYSSNSGWMCRCAHAKIGDLAPCAWVGPHHAAPVACLWVGGGPSGVSSVLNQLLPISLLCNEIGSNHCVWGLRPMSIRCMASASSIFDGRGARRTLR